MQPIEFPLKCIKDFATFHGPAFKAGEIYVAKFYHDEICLIGQDKQRWWFVLPNSTFLNSSFTDITDYRHAKDYFNIEKFNRLKIFT